MAEPDEILITLDFPETDRARLEAMAREQGFELDQRLGAEVLQFLRRNAAKPSEILLLPEIFRYGCGTTQIPPRRVLGPAGARSCLFCGHSRDQGATFHKEAHVIPAAFGNRSLFSNQECDECNLRAGNQFENHLVNALTPLRALFGGRSRRGHVMHKPRPSDGKSLIVSQGLSAAIVCHDDDDSISGKFFPEESELRLSIQGYRYRPMAVAKSLARMALFVLEPTQRQDVAWLFDWLRGDQAWRPTYVEVFWPGPQTQEYSLVVRESGTSDKPYLVEFGSGNIKYAIRLPTSPPPDSSAQYPAIDTITYGDGEALRFIHVTGDEMVKDSSMSIALKGEFSEVSEVLLDDTAHDKLLALALDSIKPGNR
jgi:hypothetical protein